jgi:hypothetical protein
LLPIDARMLAASGLDSESQMPGASGAEVTASAVAAAQWDGMSPLNRRSLLRHGLAMAALPALGLEELQQIAAAMDDARRYLDGSVLAYFRRQLTVCKSDDGTLGPRKTLPVVLGILGAVEEHARDVKPNIRRDLLTVGAEAAEFAGWLYRDGRDLSRSLYWHDRATEWAQESGDAAMCGYVLLKKAQLAFDEREPLRMLTLAQAAQHGPWSLPGRVQAEAVQQEARADAMLGASADAVNRKLDEAWRLLGASGDDDSPLGGHYNATLLTMQTAICYAEAGAPREAVDLYTKSLTETSFSIRDYGFFLSLMAGSLALAGEPEQAASTGLESATRAADTNSRRTTQELNRVLDYLKPWQNRPAVKQLQEAVAG